MRYQLDLLEPSHDGTVENDQTSHAPIVLLAGSSSSLKQDSRLYLNVSHPFSTFICGSQGSGQSHTLSCILENCRIPSRAGRVPSPLTGLVFHYVTFIGDTVESPCEAAFLSSHPDVQVRVLCSPTKVNSIRGCYSRFNIPVDVLELDQSHLNIKRIMDLMAVKQDNGEIPLYMHTGKRILREMRITQQGTKGSFDYQTFKGRVMYSGLNRGQLGPLKQRLETLENFTPEGQCFRAGHLTIVDLSCPCISPETACSLFNICLGSFLEQEQSIGRVIALDEAHKIWLVHLETLVSVVGLQRHLAARVVVSTQEPTVSTDLLNLCSVTIVHRFTSPERLRTLQKHLAAAAANPFTPKTKSENTSNDTGELSTDQNLSSLFDNVVQLGVGEALLFAPSAIVRASVGQDGRVEFHPLGSEFLPIKVRARLTSDGGKSVLSL
ncbi:hypothetical protein BDV33DRAFT_197036 [Aspergillus novoparasiticus]|uniref:P-loop containing nucleoside triphosphate hydrolase protein n=1 Tax=Aspergillus novoparasiticus TaxID=986946 RepID=A0A5N6E8V8_9EURO|nr:hypothetical protein BDV33DRAFT_197036 [Aspergillus novoparasiticus]